MPVFPTTRLHVEAAVDAALRDEQAYSVHPMSA